MYGIKIGDKHTYTDFNLNCLSCNLTEPSPVFKYIDVPGMDGKLDFTESVYGRVTFGTRKLTAEFEKECTRAEHLAFRAQLSNLFLGKLMQIILDEDLGHYLVGRIVLEPNHKNIFGSFKISAECDPYRYKIALTSITHTVTSSKTITLSNSQKPVCPVFYTDSTGMEVEFKSTRYSLITGGVEIPEITLIEGNNSLKFYGNGTITTEYREGIL